MKDAMHMNDKLKDIALATAMFDATSDGYDDEEFREGTVEELARCLSGIEADGALRHAILAMAERIEELEA